MWNEGNITSSSQLTVPLYVGRVFIVRRLMNNKRHPQKNKNVRINFWVCLFFHLSEEGECGWNRS